MPCASSMPMRKTGNAFNGRNVVTHSAWDHTIGRNRVSTGNATAVATQATPRPEAAASTTQQRVA